MIEIQGIDLLKEGLSYSQNPENVLLIPTNGVVGKHGNNIMGKGLALAIKETVKPRAIDLENTVSLPVVIGNKITFGGNVPYDCGVWEHKVKGYYRLFTLPTKNFYKDKADLELIKSGLELLFYQQKIHQKFERIFSPKLGCGCGKLSYVHEVRPLLKSYLENINNFYIAI